MRRDAQFENPAFAGSAAVMGPDGEWLTFADLPPRDTKRWVAKRKAQVVAGVRGGLLSLEEACLRYALTVEEFLSWQRAVERHGLNGLRATRQPDHRPYQHHPRH